MRDRLVIGILIAVLIVLFGLVFAILGRGEYEPHNPNEEAAQQTEIAALVLP